MTRAGLAVSLVLVGILRAGGPPRAAAGGGPVFDHLYCYKARDPNRLGGVDVDLVPAEQPPFALAEGCIISGAARELCSPVEKTVNDAGDAPVPGVGPPTQSLSNDYLCYRIRCPEATAPDVLVTDQFGSRTLTRLRPAGKICVPAVQGVPTTTTSTTTTTLAPEPCSPCRVFVTAGTQTGNMGGLSGADAICNAAAVAASPPLSGRYRAWLSTNATDARDRLSPGSGPFVRTDGAPLADDVADLLDGSLENPIACDASAACGIDGLVWTGTLADGTACANANCTHCNAWTIAVFDVTDFVGRSASAGGQWTFDHFVLCDTAARLYCIER